MRLSRTLQLALMTAILAVPLALAASATAAPQSLSRAAAMTDLPGDPLTSPFQGMVNLDSVSGIAQVYHVNLAAGERLAVRLNADAPKGIYMGLLPPGTINVFAQFIATSESESYPQLLRYQASAPGEYYVVVFASPSAPRNTWLPYSGEFKVTAGDAASEIPGVPMTLGGTDTGSHSELTDWSDVYSVPASAGEGIHLRLSNRGTGVVSSDTDLFLFSPAAKSIYGSLDPVAASEKAPQEADKILYRAPTTGTYYASTRAFGDGVDYSLGGHGHASDVGDVLVLAHLDRLRRRGLDPRPTRRGFRPARRAVRDRAGVFGGVQDARAGADSCSRFLARRRRGDAVRPGDLQAHRVPHRQYTLPYRLRRVLLQALADHIPRTGTST